MVKLVKKTVADIKVGEFFIRRNVLKGTHERMVFTLIRRSGDTVALNFADAVTGQEVDYLRLKADDEIMTVV